MLRAELVFLLFWAAFTLGADAVADANAKIKSGHPDEAVQILRDDLVKTPNGVPTSARLTEILLNQERFEEADQIINSALKANGSSALLHRVRGDLVFREGQVFEAENDYRAAFKLDNRNARAIYGVARAFQMAALREKAEKLIQDAHRIDPADPVIEEAYTRTQADTPGLVARWQESLDGLENQNSRLAMSLRRAIAIQKALNGRHSWELASPYVSSQVPLTILMNGRYAYGIGLKVTVNDAKAELQVDTGASGLYINNRLAEQAGVKRLADSLVGGIGNQGLQKTWIGFAERIQIGGIEFHNCIVDVSDEKSTGVDAGGLVGTDVFRRFMTTLDLHARKLVFDPLPGPAWDGVKPVDRYNGPELKDFDQFLNIHHMILMPTKVSETVGGEQTPGLFLVDTGASTNSISTNLAPDVTKVRNDYYGGVRGLSGKVKMNYRADRVVLQFAHFRQQIPDLRTFDLSSISRSGGVELSGIIGMPLLSHFQAVVIDYRDGRVRFDYKP